MSGTPTKAQPAKAQRQQPKDGDEGGDNAPKIEVPKVVKYIGTADVRLIREEDWDMIGSKSKDVKWWKMNGWQVTLDNFDDTALLFLDNDDEFIITHLELGQG